jgi:hypothetical protein
MVFGEQQHLGESLIKRHHVLLNAEGVGITMSERGGQDTQKYKHLFFFCFTTIT